MLKLHRLLPALTLTTALANPATAAAAGKSFHKVDSSVTDAVNRGAATVRVIVRTTPACRAAVKQSLLSHGDKILGEQASVSTLTAVVNAADLDAFDASTCIARVSDDAVVAAHTQPGGGSQIASALRGTLGLTAS